MQEESQLVEQFVDANAVAGYLKVTRRQVLEMSRRGVIPGHPLGIGTRRRVWRYKLSEVDAAVTSGSKKLLSTTPHEVAILATNASGNTMRSGGPRGQRRKV